MVANILPAEPSSPPSPDPGVKRSNSTFPEHGQIAYQIKQNHKCGNVVAYILPANPLLPPPDPGGGVKMSKLTFSKHAHVAYQLKWNHKCSHMVANIFPADPPGPWGQKFKIKLFQNIVILHIKGNCECSKMVANADRGSMNK